MNLVEVDLSKIIIDEKRHDQIIVLKEKDGNRQFPIMIGIVEASSIKMKLAKLKMPRPMTHDLIVSILDGLDASLRKLVIDKIEKNTFYAKLVIENSQGEIREIDARPSDGIALAVRSQIPIFVDESVLKTTEIPKLQ